MSNNFQLMQGDCLELMKQIPDGSVDLVLTDPPYGTVKGANLDGWTDASTEWDTRLDQQQVWAELNRIVRPNGAILIFSQEPFTSELITSAHGNLPFAYRLLWLKDHFANPLAVKKAPVNYIEDVCVFFKKYDMQGLHPLRDYVKSISAFIGRDRKQVNNELGHQRADHFFRIDTMQFSLCTERTYNELIDLFGIDVMPGFKPYAELYQIDRAFNLPDGARFKSNVFPYKKESTRHHPTQKPVALLEDLIKTYSNPGNLILDYTMGSGSTGVACANTGRRFIGIEFNAAYFEIAQGRIAAAQAQVAPANDNIQPPTAANDNCPACAGAGSFTHNNSEPTICLICNGTGEAV